MNTSLIKSALAMTAAFAVGSALATETVTPIYGATFESVAGANNDYAYTAGDLVNTYTGGNNSKWFSGSADDQSAITTEGPCNGDQALKLQTEGGTLTNQFFNSALSDINDARTNAMVRFEAQVKFVASDTLECGVEAGGDAKFALYAYAPDGGPTNLVIFHTGAVSGETTNNVISNVTIDTEDYQQVVVDYFTSGLDSLFSVSVGGVQAESDEAMTDAQVGKGEDNVKKIWFVTVNGTGAGALAISSLCFKGTGMVDDIAISKVEEAQQQADWVVDSTTVSNETAAVAYPALASSALANANAGELTDWAKANNIDFATVEADATGTLVDAFLLNCSVAEVADEKEEFVLNITIDENGVPVITLPAGFDYNGTLQLKGATSLTGTWENISEPSATYKFYKYELSLPTL